VPQGIPCLLNDLPTCKLIGFSLILGKNLS
jgi:hypothetical protein